MSLWFPTMLSLLHCWEFCFSYFSHCLNKICDKRNLENEVCILASTLRFQSIMVGKLWYKSLRQLVILHQRSGDQKVIMMLPTLIYSFYLLQDSSPPTVRVWLPMDLCCLIYRLPHRNAQRLVSNYSRSCQIGKQY